MGAELLSGKVVSAKIREELKIELINMKKDGIIAGLAVVIVGDDAASRVYVNAKKKACAEIGIESYEYALSEETSQAELLDLVNSLNSNNKVNGILVQLPLPKHIDEETIINAINPSKDVDAFHPHNVGKIMIGNYDFLPCTPAGVMELIKESGVEISGKECVVVGRSNIVGKPQAMLLLHSNGTITVCHSRTRDLKEVCRRADILVVAIGKAEFVTKEYVKPGAVVIDVGMNRLENKKLVGDVAFEEVAEVASYITPVPGGVGPMTIAMLMKNTVKAAILQSGKK